MKRLLFLILLIVGSMSVKAQFPTTDSLRAFINRYIRNSAVESFQNLRLNTALIGISRYIDSSYGGQVESFTSPNDSVARIITIGGDTLEAVIRGSGGGGVSGTINYLSKFNTSSSINDATDAVDSAGHYGFGQTSNLLNALMNLTSSSSTLPALRMRNTGSTAGVLAEIDHASMGVTENYFSNWRWTAHLDRDIQPEFPDSVNDDFAYTYGFNIGPNGARLNTSLPSFAVQRELNFIVNGFDLPGEGLYGRVIEDIISTTNRRGSTVRPYYWIRAWDRPKSLMWWTSSNYNWSDDSTNTIMMSFDASRAVMDVSPSAAKSTAGINIGRLGNNSDPYVLRQLNAAGSQYNGLVGFRGNDVAVLGESPGGEVVNNLFVRNGDGDNMYIDIVDNSSNSPLVVRGATFAIYNDVPGENINLNKDGSLFARMGNTAWVTNGFSSGYHGWWINRLPDRPAQFAVTNDDVTVEPTETYFINKSSTGYGYGSNLSFLTTDGTSFTSANLVGQNLMHMKYNTKAGFRLTFNSNQASDNYYLADMIWGNTATGGSSQTDLMKLTNGGNLLLGNMTDNGSKLQVNGDATVTDEAYDATAWNGSLEVPTKNAIRDKIESLGTGITSINSQTGSAITISNQGGIVVSNPSSNNIGLAVDVTSDLLPRTIDAVMITAQNTGTTETDLFSKNIAGNTLSADKRTLNFEIDGEFNDNTATAQLKLYFGGNVTLNTGAINISTAFTAWRLKGYIIRTSSSTAHVTYELHAPGLATPVFVGYTNLTSLDFTTTNVFKITAQAGGAGGGTADITAHSWQVLYKPAP